MSAYNICTAIHNVRLPVTVSHTLKDPYRGLITRVILKQPIHYCTQCRIIIVSTLHHVIVPVSLTHTLKDPNLVFDNTDDLKTGLRSIMRTMARYH